ncbi:hypothetical protein [Pseudomonas sp. CGJS7]|uniref:hypothetical protein n=1 Tax=Pseudomonas sp. CGJS7 TaxID=3109348 RepID=UPI00300B48D5
MDITTIVDEVVEQVRTIKHESGCLVGIDGFDGSGKTTLAFELARQMDGIRVGLDSYVEKDRDADSYVGLLRLDHLKRDLENLCARFSVVVVDGVCLLEALAVIGASVDLHIYVKKYSPQGLWHPGFHLEDYLAGQPAGSWLERSVYGYHDSYAPHDRAAVHYHWSDA